MAAFLLRAPGVIFHGLDPTSYRVCVEFIYHILRDTYLFEVLVIEVGLTSLEAWTNQTGNVSAHYNISTVLMQALQAKVVKALIKDQKVLCSLTLQVANVA